MATIPKRMNPISVKIRTYRKQQTIMDSDFAEPLSSRIYSEEFEVFCQVVKKKEEEEDATLTGDQTRSSGHLTFRKSDVDFIPQKGDKIVEIDGEPEDFDVIEVRNSGHLKGRANLLMVFFGEPVDRESI